MLEDVLTANFIDLGCKDPDFGVKFGVLAEISLLGEDRLQVYVLFSQVLDVLLGSFEFLPGSLVQLESEVDVEIYQFALVIFEFVQPGVDCLLGVGQLVIQLFHPFCQDAQDRGIV